mgnify:CR=1 FL=1
MILRIVSLRQKSHRPRSNKQSGQDIREQWPSAPSNNLEYWSGLGAVGDFFKTASGVEVLVSFNLVDTVMALVQRRELIKYLYHHQEAMWNKIFAAYFGWDKLREMSKKYVFKGWLEI